MHAILFVLDTNLIVLSFVQFPVCVPSSQTSCDVICNVIGHLGLRDSVSKQRKKMLLFYHLQGHFSRVKKTNIKWEKGVTLRVASKKSRRMAHARREEVEVEVEVGQLQWSVQGQRGEERVIQMS